MREFTFGILFSLLISVNSIKSNSTVAQAEGQGPDIRVEHLKQYCNVKNGVYRFDIYLVHTVFAHCFLKYYTCEKNT